MAGIEVAARVALGLPEVTEGQRGEARTWLVAGKAFAWVRPFSKADIRRYGAEAPPDGPILAVRVRDLDEKDAVLSFKSTDPQFQVPQGQVTVPAKSKYELTVNETPLLEQAAEIPNFGVSTDYQTKVFSQA